MQGCTSRFNQTRSFIHASLQLVFLKALFPYHFSEVSRHLYFNMLYVLAHPSGAWGVEKTGILSEVRGRTSGEVRRWRKENEARGIEQI
jgi:hypothetical protein